MLFLKILGVYYLWKIKRTKKVPLEAGRQGQESHCGAGGQEPWVGQPSLSFGAGKVRLGDGKWRREETTAPVGPPPQVAPWFPPPAGLRDTARLHLQQGDLRALQAPCPVARPCSGPLFRAAVGRPLSWAISHRRQSQLPFAGPEPSHACSHSSWAPGGPHARDPLSL